MAQIDESAISQHGQEAADERAPLLGPSSYRGNEQERAERDNLLSSDRENDEEAVGRDNAGRKQEHQVSAHIARRLYLSHFLSTWNSRVFEFGAVLYLATIFPGTLLPMSVYAFTRGFAAVIFAPAVGQYIDTGNRLQVVRVSIMLQRLVVAASCIIFFVMNSGQTNWGPGGQKGILALLAFFACTEKLCSIMNLVSVEKDWVIVVTDKDPEALRRINAQMRRIDLICKLLGPLFIALINGASTEIAIIVNFVMNLASVVIEYFAIARVYYEVPKLQDPKRQMPLLEERRRSRRQEGESWLVHNFRHLRKVVAKSLTDFHFYFHHHAFLPSFAGALLYLTVLNFGGQMVTYLLSSGYTSIQVGIARTFSVAFEVLATWVAPWLMGRLGPIRGGLWLSSWQVATLIAGVSVFWALEKKPIISASGLVVGTIFSRLGLRGFDLCVQVIVQEEVEAESRGAFSSVEAAWQNAFELLSFASTMILARPQQFRWPTLISVIAIVSASLSFAVFTRLRRGHLVHLDRLCGCWGDEKWEERDDRLENALSRTASENRG